jgi:hypothetical protein
MRVDPPPAFSSQKRRFPAPHLAADRFISRNGTSSPRNGTFSSRNEAFHFMFGRFSPWPEPSRLEMKPSISWPDTSISRNETSISRNGTSISINGSPIPTAKTCLRRRDAAHQTKERRTSTSAAPSLFNRIKRYLDGTVSTFTVELLDPTLLRSMVIAARRSATSSGVAVPVSFHPWMRM